MKRIFIMAWILTTAVSLPAQQAIHAPGSTKRIADGWKWALDQTGDKEFKDGFWKHGDWDRAIREGMNEVGMEYSGKFGFAETRMYNSIHHGVVRAPEALGCADCHQVEAVSCRRCHRNAAGMDQPSHTRKIYPEAGERFDFRALGYEDDPALIGGRFTIGLGRGRPNR